MLPGAWLIQSPEVRFFPVPRNTTDRTGGNRVIDPDRSAVKSHTADRHWPVITAEIILLSAVLYFSDATMNPLAIFYLVEVATTAVPPRVAWACHDQL